MTTLQVDPGSVYAGIADYPPDSGYGPRVLRDSELVWMLRGRAVWSAAGHPSVTLAPGSVLLVPPTTRDRFAWDTSGPSRHGYVHFSLRTPPAVTGPLVVQPARHEPVAALLSYVLTVHTPPGPDGTEAEAAACALSTVLHLLRTGSPGAARAELPEALTRMAHAVRARWEAEGPCRLSRAQLAAAACLSPAHLTRLFAREFGTGPVAALELLRIRHAALLLDTTGLSVRHVARRAGYPDAFHFSRRFRACTGLSPSAHRLQPAPPPRPVAELLSRLRPLSEALGLPLA
ncbi:helix-turn-helix transcriptional regulator [Streptomyces longwoodensis]|uniref:helix-turn-helix transcriptional regulator n=1 Tax=Streptomyces longwoodensis TaxID=68231 RepID=UPI0033F0B257